MTRKTFLNKLAKLRTKYKWILRDNFIRANTHKDKTASLDRIDNSKGYELGNVQWIHKDINMMKRNFSEKEFLDMVKLVAEYKS